MPDLYCFDQYEVRPAERQLLIDGVPAALGARAFDLLVVLIEHHDRVVTKGELLDAVWPGLVVEENNLQVHVSSLRKLLGSNAIATVPGRGYQFVAALDANNAHTTRGQSRPLPNNLPHARTRFIGRETALSDCATLLRDTRLLTLSGIGGCGKTRLAQELALREINSFPDGVWFVDLGPLQDAQRLPATVAETIGVQVGHLTDHLKARRALVVMDNCEHVIAAATQAIQMLLDSCGALKIIATSREVLGTAGEQVFAVRSLSLPATTDLDEVRSSEAVRLFVDHARLVIPDFDVAGDNAEAITEICRRLDGIALAIELAAARVRVLSLNDIRARLDDRFRLLTGANRALPRHQTLHATMQWSYDLLAPCERQLFREMSVFAGGCTLAAATRVASDGADEYDVLERLTALHDKSLLLVDRDTQAQPRYRLLETVRQYAQDRLNEAGQGDEARTRHLLHYVILAEKAASDMRGPKQSAWYKMFRREQENLLAAHAWCAHAPDGGKFALRLTASTWLYWLYISQPERGYRLAEEALALAGSDSETPECCRALHAMAMFAYKIGRYEEMQRLAQRGLAIARRLGDAGLVFDGHYAMAIGLAKTGRKTEALAHYSEGRELAQAVGDDLRLSSALNGIAEIHRSDGDFAAAEALYREAIRLASAEGRAQVRNAAHLARLLIAAEKFSDARATLVESRSLANGADYGVFAECAEVAATLASSLGEHRVAARFHGAMLRQLHEAGMVLDPADEALAAPRIEKARTTMGAVDFDAAQAEGWALSYDESVSEVDRWLGVKPVSR